MPSLQKILDKHIGKIYKDWNEVVKAKRAMRADISDWLESKKKEYHKPRVKGNIISIDPYEDITKNCIKQGYNACIDELKKECV